MRPVDFPWRVVVAKGDSCAVGVRPAIKFGRELAEDEALDVLEQLMGDKQQSRRHVQIPAFRAVSFVKAMMERTDLAKKLGCADDRGEADRDKIVTAYDCMRPHKQACADTECFLNYFGPRGRLSTSHQKTSLGGLLNILK